MAKSKYAHEGKAPKSRKSGPGKHRNKVTLATAPLKSADIKSAAGDGDKEGVTPMAGLPITIVGTITTDADGTKQCTINGVAGITGLEVGGGPIIPPAPPNWGPGGPPGPQHPIWGPPGINFPDKPGYPPVVGGGPIIPPDVPPDIEPPPDKFTWHTAWTPETGWVVVAVPNDPHPVPSK
jgi:hypothetical protein